MLWAAYADVLGTRRLVLGAVLAQCTERSPVRARTAVWAHSPRMVKAIQRMSPDGFALAPPFSQPRTDPSGPVTRDGREKCPT